MTEIDSIIVDKAVLIKGKLVGYLNGQAVITYGGCEDYSHIHLYDENGNEVPHTPAPPSLEEQISTLSAALLEMAGVIYG